MISMADPSLSWPRAKTFADLRQCQEGYLQGLLGSSPWRDGPVPGSERAFTAHLVPASAHVLPFRWQRGVDTLKKQTPSWVEFYAPSWMFAMQVVASFALRCPDGFGEFHPVGDPAPTRFGERLDTTIPPQVHHGFTGFADFDSTPLLDETPEQSQQPDSLHPVPCWALCGGNLPGLDIGKKFNESVAFVGANGGPCGT